jgi:ATP-dependent Clp protease ATP-binding subunit ClpA
MSDRFDKFTERAKKALVLAQDEARRFNHNYIGTEHLLVGLVAEGNGIAAKVLANFGLDLPRVREAFAFRIGRGDQPVKGDITMAPRAKRVIELAIEEARGLNHNYVGTEHLLLGLIRREEGTDRQPVAIMLLDEMGVDLERVREQLIRVVSGAPGGTAAAGTPGVRGPVVHVPGPVVQRTRDNVVTCRVDDRALDALDALVEAGVYTTRSEAAARLIVAGMEANRPLLEKVYANVAEIRRLRDQTRQMTESWRAEGAAETPGERAAERPAGDTPDAPDTRSGEPGAGAKPT